MDTIEIADIKDIQNVIDNNFPNIKQDKNKNSGKSSIGTFRPRQNISSNKG